MAHQLDDFGGACLVKFAIPTTEAFDKEVGVYFECFLKRIGHVPLQVPCVTCVIERVPLLSQSTGHCAVVLFMVGCISNL